MKTRLYEKKFTLADSISKKWRPKVKVVISGLLSTLMITGTFSSVSAADSSSANSIKQYLNQTSLSLTQPERILSNSSVINMKTTEIIHSLPDGIDATKPVKWTTSDPYVAYVDMIGNANGDNSGKILAVSSGTATITATQGTTSVKVTVNVSEGQSTNLEKVVYYYRSGEDKIPNDWTKAILKTNDVAAPAGRKFPSASYSGYVDDKNGVKWMLANDKTSITLYDSNLVPADQIQYLQGGRYIPQDDNGVTEVISAIMPDGNNGLWIKSADGNATHIVRKQISLMGRALLEEEISRNLIDRLGYQSGEVRFTSQADKINAVMGTKDASDISRYISETDNDGTWTSLYGMGELARYKYMKATFGVNDPRTKDALQSATRATEAVTLLAYISGRQLKVPAKEEVQPYVLKLLGAKLDGSDEGKPVFMERDGSYTLNSNGNTPVPDGYISRSYKIAPQGTVWTATNLNDGNRWLRKGVGTAVDKNGNIIEYAQLLSPSNNSNATDYSSLKSYSNIPVPERLRKLYDPQLNIPDDRVYYKDDTSSDEIVADYAFYNMAYDTFKRVDPELAGLIKTAIISNVNHIVINNYYLTGLDPRISVTPDYKIGGKLYSTGYVNSGNGLNVPNMPSKWGNFNPSFLDGVENIYGREDYEDGPLNGGIVLEILQAAMKMVSDKTVPAYTGVAGRSDAGYKAPTPVNFENEFALMTKGKGTVSATNGTQDNTYNGRYNTPFTDNLLDMIKQYHRRYFGIAAHNGDDIGQPGTSFESYLNYSDEEEEASLFFGIASSLPATVSDNVLNAYHTAMNQWWYNEKRSKNPFLTYFYAVSLADLKAAGVDVRGDQVDVASAKWALTRMPSNLVKWDVSGTNRNDVTQLLNSDWVDQLLPRDEFRMTKYNGDWFNPDGGSSQGMESSTVVSLPYWFSMEPKNAHSIASLGSVVTSVNQYTPDISAEGSKNIILNVGESKDLNVTLNKNAYIKNISWMTDSWNMDTQIIDLQTKYEVEKNAGVYNSTVTGLHVGSAIVTALTTDGGFGAPRTVTYHIMVVDPNANAIPKNLNIVSDSDFKYPTWLTKAMADPHKNTNGHVYVSVNYSSSNEASGTVDPITGAVSYKTGDKFNVIATVTYSDMTLNDSARFETNSHVMTFVCSVQKVTNN